MKTIVFTALLAAMTFMPTASKADSVNGYVRRDGTYVAPYQRTSPNNTRLDNYSTRGNTNPYTGQRGYASPYPSR